MKRNFGFRFLACVAVLLCCMMPLGMSAFAEGAEDKETALLSWYRENVDSAAESENFSCVSMARVGETEFYRVSLKEDVFIPEETYVRLGEAVLQLPNSAPCVVYASGKVYTLVEAYTAGVLNPYWMFSGSGIWILTESAACRMSFCFGSSSLPGTGI